MATSTGRGGAGNMSSTPAQPTNTADLVTPHIKQDMYTTGRGGTGNMATNLKAAPEMARAAQDVGAPVRREPGSSTASGGGAEAKMHMGRGGEGNFKRTTSTEQGDGAARERVRDQARRGSTNLVEGGRKLIKSLRGEKKEREREGEAAEQAVADK